MVPEELIQLERVGGRKRRSNPSGRVLEPEDKGGETREGATTAPSVLRSLETGKKLGRERKLEHGASSILIG